MKSPTHASLPDVLLFEDAEGEGCLFGEAMKRYKF
jgi:hypothetical protein